MGAECGPSTGDAVNDQGEVPQHLGKGIIQGPSLVRDGLSGVGQTWGQSLSQRQVMVQAQRGPSRRQTPHGTGPRSGQRQDQRQDCSSPSCSIPGASPEIN